MLGLEKTSNRQTAKEYGIGGARFHELDLIDSRNGHTWPHDKRKPSVDLNGTDDEILLLRVHTKWIRPVLSLPH
jgi:hypothetical protein